MHDSKYFQKYIIICRERLKLCKNQPHAHYTDIYAAFINEKKVK